MRISSKRRRWLTREMIFRCIHISLAIIVIALILQLAQMVFSPDLSMSTRAIFFLFIWGLLSVVILVLGFTAPDLMEIVFQMLGSREKEEKKQKKDNNRDR